VEFIKLLSASRDVTDNLQREIYDLKAKLRTKGKRP
jgi:hypothetical protein